jgi:hypothetical protein
MEGAHGRIRLTVVLDVAALAVVEHLKVVGAVHLQPMDHILRRGSSRLVGRDDGNATQVLRSSGGTDPELDDGLASGRI